MPDQMHDHGRGFRPADAPPGTHRPNHPGSKFREATGVVDVSSDAPKPTPSKKTRAKSLRKE